MIETLLSPTSLRCARCQAALSETTPEFEFADWIVRCLQCSAKNVIEVAGITQSVIAVAVVGWR